MSEDGWLWHVSVPQKLVAVGSQNRLPTGTRRRLMFMLSDVRHGLGRPLAGEPPAPPLSHHGCRAVVPGGAGRLGCDGAGTCGACC